MFLIAAPTAPQVGGDIDLDNDGVADGEFDQWGIHDSISMHPSTNPGTVAYGQIVFAGGGDLAPPIGVPEGSTLVTTNGYGYFARTGDSVGSDAEDWVAASVVNNPPNPNTVSYEIVGGPQGVPVAPADPSQPMFIGRTLDHFGDSNFVGAVRGTVIREPMEGEPAVAQPAENVLVFLDANRNGQLDNLIYRVEPNDFLPGTDLTNAYPGVTLTSVDAQGDFTNRLIEPALQDPATTTNQVFSHDGDFLSNETKKLRVDFHRPVNFVSIVGIAEDFPIGDTYMRLDTYDADGNMLDSTVSLPLPRGASQVVASFTQDDVIAYAEIYADTNITDVNGNPIFFEMDGLIDQLVYRQFEPNAITDANGAYEIENLPIDEYTAIFRSPGADTMLIGAQPVPISITKYENYILNPNALPVADPIDLVLEENTALGTEVAAVTAVDPDGGALSYRFDDPASPFSVDPVTGVISVSDVLDFESTPIIDTEVIVVDALGGELMLPLHVELLDLNEAPIVTNNPLTVAENTEVGVAVGQIPAFDPDFNQDQTLTYTIEGGSGEDIFNLNPVNGLVTVADSVALDFETNNVLSLIVQVADDGDPSQFTEIVQSIQLTDQNDAPELNLDPLFVDENSSVVGNVTALDVDANQSLRFLLDGGVDQALFRLSESGELTTAPGVILDFETQPTFSIDVTVIDNGTPPLSDTATVQVQLFDLNEPATIDQVQVTLPENSPGGTVVTQFTLTDPENAPENYRLSLLSQLDAEKFTFDPDTNTLEVADGADLNFEDRVIQELAFEVIDDTMMTQTSLQVIQVVLTDANDAPSITTSNLIISEDAAAGSQVAVIVTNDVDDGDTVTVAITGGSAATLFDLDADTQVLTVADGVNLDFETMSDLDLVIQATDLAGAMTESTVQIELNDVNEPPTISPNLDVPSSATGQPFEMVIPPDFVTDQDGSEFEITILDAQGGLPAWLKYDSATQTLSGLPKPADAGTYPLILRAFEFGPLELFSTLDFTVDVEVGDTQYTNGLNPLDVDANNQVAALDALIVINFIGRYGDAMAPSVTQEFTGFLDVNSDLVVTAVDALRVINALSVESFEGEQATGDLLLGDEREESTDAALLSLLAETGLF